MQLVSKTFLANATLSGDILSRLMLLEGYECRHAMQAKQVTISFSKNWEQFFPAQKLYIIFKTIYGEEDFFLGKTK